MVYYVYIYLNVLNPGKFEYGDLSFDFEPFYVGKGFKNRHLYHLKKVLNKNKYKSSQKYKIIENILKSGLFPIIIKIKENLSEVDSLVLEKEIITKIGRSDLLRGPLSNLNDGGLKPQDNYRHSKETKLKISRSNKKLFTRGLRVISPSGEAFENIRLNKFCDSQNLNYDKMRKSINKGKISVKKTKNTNIKTLNCNGWVVSSTRLPNLKIERKVKYILIDPNCNETVIYSNQSMKDICKSLNLNFRILKLYRNKGPINIRKRDQCKNKTTLNCEKWQFIDPLNREHDFSSKRKISWKITSPKNEVYLESNLIQFCENNSLSYRTFSTFKNRGVIDMSIRSSYSQKVLNSIGWICESI